MLVRDQPVRQRLRLAAGRRHLIQVRVDRGVCRGRSVGRRGEDDRRAVGRPVGVELFTESSRRPLKPAFWIDFVPASRSFAVLPGSSGCTNT